MVEKKEFAIAFRKQTYQNGIEEFIPMRVIEGTYDPKCEWFTEETDNIRYIHIEDSPNHIVGYACRTKIEFVTGSLSKDSLEQIKNEMLSYANQYTFRRNINNCIVAINKKTGSERLFEDIDTMPEFTLKNQTSNNQILDETLGMSPFELEEKIKQTIKGQDEAIRKIVTALWTTLKFRHLKKKNMLIVGPSGVGKTAIFEKIKDILNIPIIIFSVPGLSQAGYVGRSTDEILKQIYFETGCDEEEAKRAIVILDELDKIAARGNGEVSTTGVQNELLKIIEGCERYVDSDNPNEDSFSIDTSQMIFIGTGAFQELFDKKNTSIGFTSTKENHQEEINTTRLIQYGLKRELIGRLPILVQLNSLGKKELREIILESNESELLANIAALESLGVTIENLDEVIDFITDDALNRKLGARGLILTINNLFEQIFYEVGNNPEKYSKVVFGQNIVNDNKDFTLIKKRNYTKKKKLGAN